MSPQIISYVFTNRIHWVVLLFATGLISCGDSSVEESADYLADLVDGKTVMVNQETIDRLLEEGRAEFVDPDSDLLTPYGSSTSSYRTWKPKSSKPVSTIRKVLQCVAIPFAEPQCIAYAVIDNKQVCTNSIDHYTCCETANGGWSCVA